MNHNAIKTNKWINLNRGDGSLRVEAQVFGTHTYQGLQTQIEALNSTSEQQNLRIPKASDVPSLIQAGFDAGFLVDEEHPRHGDIMLARANDNDTIATIAPYYDAPTVIIRTIPVNNDTLEL